MAKKSLGQHFLNGPGIVDDIITAAAIDPAETVLEIGPGKGVLTEALLNAGARVIAVEKDDDLSGHLLERFSGEQKKGRFNLYNADILEKDISSLVETPYKVVANIPYNITGKILRHILSARVQPCHAVLMVQKEVAERICGTGGKESILSISVKAYGTPEYVRTVRRGSFTPQPHVDSAIVALSDISREKVKHIPEDTFFTVVKTGFKEPRKQLHNNLAPLLKEVPTILGSCGISPHARAETLSVDEWLCVTKAFIEKSPQNR